MGSALFDRATSEHLLPLLSARMHAPYSAYVPAADLPVEVPEEEEERGYGLGPEWLKRGGVDASRTSLPSTAPKRLDV